MQEASRCEPLAPKGLLSTTTRCFRHPRTSVRASHLDASRWPRAPLPGTFPPACPPCARPRRARARARARPGGPRRRLFPRRLRTRATDLPSPRTRAPGARRPRSRGDKFALSPQSAGSPASPHLTRGAPGHVARVVDWAEREGGRTPVRGEADALGPRETVRARFAATASWAGSPRRPAARWSASRLPERPRDARDASEDQAQPPRRAPRGAGGGDRAGAQDEPARARRTGGRSVSRNRARLRSRREELERGPGGGDGGPVRLRRVRGGGGEGHGESSGTLAIAGVVGGSRDAADVGPGGDGRGGRPIADAEPLFGPATASLGPATASSPSLGPATASSPAADDSSRGGVATLVSFRRMTAPPRRRARAPSSPPPPRRASPSAPPEGPRTRTGARRRFLSRRRRRRRRRRKTGRRRQRQRFRRSRRFGSGPGARKHGFGSPTRARRCCSLSGPPRPRPRPPHRRRSFFTRGTSYPRRVAPRRVARRRVARR